MQRRFLNRLITWQATAFYNATARLRRSKVTAILCSQCQKWIKPRHCDGVLLICKDCLRDAVDMARGSLAYRRATVQAALVNQRTQHRDTRDWRQHAARVTSAH